MAINVAKEVATLRHMTVLNNMAANGLTTERTETHMSSTLLQESKRFQGWLRTSFMRQAVCVTTK